MSENNENNKDKIKQLEKDLKSAFKEESFDAVSKLIEEVKAIDPENRFAIKIMEKLEKAKSDAKKKENAEKIKQYQEMIKKMFKEGNLENVRKLSGELKEFDEKSAEKWVQQVDKIEADVKRKQNAEQIKSISSDIKTAFKEGNFSQVEKFCAKLKELDPEDKTSDKWLEAVKKAKSAELRKVNAEKIKELETQIKGSFKEGNFSQVEKLCTQLKELDPEDKTSETWLSKVEKSKNAESRKANAEKIKELETQIKDAFKEERYDIAKKSIQELVELDSESSLAEKFMKKIAKATGEEVVLKSAEQVQPVSQDIPVSKTTPDTEPVQSAEVNTESALAVENKQEETVQEPVQATEETASQTNVFAPVTPVIPEAKGQAEPEPVTQKSDEQAESKGNVFTRMFKGKEELESSSKSIIDTIVEKSDKNEKKEDVAEEKTKKGEGIMFLKFSKAFMQFSIAFVVLSAGFFYVENIDINNTVLGLFNIEENNASRLHAASTLLEEKKSEEAELTKENNNYQQGYSNRYEETINKIIENRLNWPDILAKINEVADYIYERNEISQYIKFNNFSFDAEKRTVTVGGSLSDPLGKNLTKMIELEEAFRYYPKDRTNPDDKTEPYFKEFKEFNSLSKSLDKKTGKYTSNFQLSFELNPSSE
ncbi:hypothetical protein JW758_04860 [Candidatus Peregrinibacteria bacterium]|nr:hypothetical protein [Candidatus Peregrinibacteria bacterium]